MCYHQQIYNSQTMAEKNVDKNFITFSRQCGRIQIRAAIFRQGPDLQVQLTGGAAHIGAVAYACPNAPPCAMGAPGHRECEVAEKMARTLCEALRCNVAVSAGIHYDDINRAEVAAAMRLCDELPLDIIACL